MNTFYISINTWKSDNPYSDYSKTFDELEREGFDLHPCEKYEKEEKKAMTMYIRFEKKERYFKYKIKASSSVKFDFYGDFEFEGNVLNEEIIINNSVIKAIK